MAAVEERTPASVEADSQCLMSPRIPIWGEETFGGFEPP
jgi:hypothetical protein